MKFDEKLLSFPYLIQYHKLYDGVQYFFKFNKHRSYSVIRHSYSHGGKQGFYELVPVVLNEEDFEIIGEPAGWLTIEEVLEILEG